LALNVLVEICRKGAERNRLSAAVVLLDRGYGKPLQQLDLVALNRKLSELTADELATLQARVVSDPADDVVSAAFAGPQSDLFH
jgi:hypothetical protein